jgi:hypothetical protein
MGCTMKIRAVSELLDFLGDRKQARKRELVSLSHDLSFPRGTPDARLCRAAVMLSYAHWEGFVKDAARAYVRLVSHKSRNLADLTQSFQALVCRQELLAAQPATKRIQPHIMLVKRFTDDANRSCSIDAEAAIDTESNLSSTVFENICFCVGLDFHSFWATYGPFIDDLLRNRCCVAHGELYTPPATYAKETVTFSIVAIDRFSTEIENAAVQQKYTR